MCCEVWCRDVYCTASAAHVKIKELSREVRSQTCQIRCRRENNAIGNGNGSMGYKLGQLKATRKRNVHTQNTKSNRGARSSTTGQQSCAHQDMSAINKSRQMSHIMYPHSINSIDTSRCQLKSCPVCGRSEPFDCHHPTHSGQCHCGVGAWGVVT